MSEHLTPLPIEVEEQPDFSFMGTDGQYYIIGNSPREFEHQVHKALKEHGTLGSHSPNLVEFIEMWDEWIVMHLRVIPGQEHIDVNRFRELYFAVDRPHILQHVMRRFMAVTQATNKTIDVFSNALNSIRREMASRGHTEDQHGSETAERSEAV